MDLEEIKRRLAQRRMKQVELASHLGIEAQKVSLSLSGKRKFTVPEMDKLRALLTDDPTGAPVRAIPYLGSVPGGNWREAVQRSSMSMPAPDPSIPPNAFALKVDGDSMDLLVDDGATIIVDPDDKQLFPGKYYVVINAEGETTFKQFLSDPARLAPCSSNPSHVPIDIGSGEAFRVVGRVIWRASRM
jgi:repressor LexA